MGKMKNTDKQIENCVISELRNLISEFENKTLTKQDILNYVSDILLHTNLDSRIIVKVLEDVSFGSEGKFGATRIKVIEGW